MMDNTHERPARLPGLPLADSKAAVTAAAPASVDAAAHPSRVGALAGPAKAAPGWESWGTVTASLSVRT